MAEAKPSAGAWLSRGMLAGLFLTILYPVALGPTLWLLTFVPLAWQESFDAVFWVMYTPADYALASELVPDWLCGLFLAYMEWWGGL